MSDKEFGMLIFKRVTVVDDEATGALMAGIRVGLGLSGAELARRLKLSQAYVADLEMGRRCWTPSKLARWESVLKAEDRRQKQIKS